MNFALSAGTVVRLVLAGAVATASAGSVAIAGVPSAAASAVVAQSDSASPAGGTTAGRRHVMAQALMSLGLSDDQKNKIRGIMRDAKQQNASVTDPTVRRANFKAAFAKIDTVLTSDQRTQLHAKLDQLRKDRDSGSQS